MVIEKITVVREAEKNNRIDSMLFFLVCKGCPTCECIDVPKQQDVQCEEIVCDVVCKYGYQRDERGCQQCACNTCPMTRCRMFCMYGFRRNEDGCEVCECDWSPVVENIQCDDVWVYH